MNEARTVGELLAFATRRIAESLDLDTRTARLEARVLAGHVLHVGAEWLIAHDKDAIGNHHRASFMDLVARRSTGEPIAYITGTREFYGRAFRVTPDVLIPRPETELLVDHALDRIPQNAAPRILELGCGSGCVALTLALQRPRAQITAMDSSARAVRVARDNAEHLHVAVEFHVSDWFDAVSGRRFDMIVCNPPYIADTDPHLERGDLRFEPPSALASGSEGLNALKHIIYHAPSFLNAGGYLLLEHGYNQGNTVACLMAERAMTPLHAGYDLAGIHRTTTGKLSD